MLIFKFGNDRFSDVSGKTVSLHKFGDLSDLVIKEIWFAANHDCSMEKRFDPCCFATPKLKTRKMSILTSVSTFAKDYEINTPESVTLIPIKKINRLT